MKSPSRTSAAWGKAARGELRWPASIAVAVALFFQATLPPRLVLGPQWFIPVLELALLLPLSIVAPRRVAGEHNWLRRGALALIAIINVANAGSLALLVHYLLQPGSKATASQLLFASAEIWLTNVIVFALWYWELDRGGPDERASDRHRQPDFLFPQMGNPGCAPTGWSPMFVDYLYVAFVNAMAFSPGDTMPLTRWAKLLMMAQALTSLLTVALVAARAVGLAP
ncbi:MAG: hypothetical protein DLM53_12040 [Candidatus Eremiobacter antarcticus]|nr:hypothetical protein [Candidatus Eremiobacteraeota bacterium]MBC5808932.1 hypothetical protein [Candidatus Eremiobacteraeota bacterium]PZR60385.1 MAG: hypothetical protein DLM53_12040 [Candidatus Eremiobacter sp. RRmetagenome_bin22]